MITTLGVLRFDAQSCEIMLVSVHPGVSVETVRDNTGWPLQIADQLTETPKPTEIELDMLQRFDPQRYWTGS